MKNFLLGLSLFLMQCGVCFAQYVVKSQDELAQLKKLPLEKVYVHYNSAVLFPGEYVYYSLYCINAQTNKLSNISRIAYVELVGEDLKTKLFQKVRLENGRGQGDFFIPVSLPSGNYKFFAYTQWMKNGGQEQLFQDDVIVINPYRTDQEAILENSNAFDSTIGYPYRSEPAYMTVKKGDGTIVLMTDKNRYGQREKVVLTPRNFKGPLGYGSYSVSVRRKDDLGAKLPLASDAFAMQYFTAKNTIPQTVNDSVFLPEQRGELFFGNVRLTKGNIPAVDMTIIISIPGTDFQIRSAITDKDGNFYTYINKEYSASAILAQVLNDSIDKYSISFEKTPNLNYNGLDFGNYTISKQQKEAILKRSIYNQIENGYYNTKPDSILSFEIKDPFDGGVPTVVDLDDYTRFNTLQETLVEIVANVWVKKLPDGSYTFWVREDNEPYEESYAGDPPLVLVDGVFVPNHNDLLNFNARKIKRLRILRDPLVMGSKKYDGMVAIETINGDFLETGTIKKISSQPLMQPSPKKNYYKQRYGDLTRDYNRIPDFRYQLFWEPNVFIKDNEVSYEFYTSDIPGEYEIVLEGFTTYGKPISVKETIVVN